MIPIDLDLSRKNQRPPIIPDLIIKGVTVGDFDGTVFPGSFDAVVDTGSGHCVLPTQVQHYFALSGVDLEEVGSINVRGFRKSDPVSSQPVYKIQLFLPGQPPFVAYALFEDTDEMLIGRSTMRDRVIDMNFATGKGSLRIAP